MEINITLLSLIFLISLALPTRAANVVLIFTDDLSTMEYETGKSEGLFPNLSQLENESTVFDRSFVTHSLCCPSRATLLTGQYTHNHHVWSNNPPNGGVGRLDDTSTLATWLSQAGVETGYVGKYLNGYATEADAPQDSPLHPGYLPPGWMDWRAMDNPYNITDFEVNLNGDLQTIHEYQTDWIAAQAEDMIGAMAGNPFFVVISPLTPHLELGPQTETCQVNIKELQSIRPAPRHEGAAAAIAMPRGPAFNEADVSDKPKWIRNGVAKLKHSEINCYKSRFRMRLEAMMSVDDLVGRVRTRLADLGLEDETTIIFTSDNGWIFGDHRLCCKIVAYEPSLRVPLVIHSPGLSPAHTSRYAINNDLAPTILDTLGVSIPASVDGSSLLPLLADPNAPWRLHFLVEAGDFGYRQGQCCAPGLRAIRTAPEFLAYPDHLYVEWGRGDRELYDMVTDPDQLDSKSVHSGYQSPLITQYATCSGASCRNLEGF